MLHEGGSAVAMTRWSLIAGAEIPAFSKCACGLEVLLGAWELT